MTLLFLLAWPMSVTLLWLALRVELRDSGPVSGQSSKVVHLLLGLPPTLLLIPFALALLFGPGASYRLWGVLWLTSGLLSLAYVVTIVVLAFLAATRHLIRPTILAFLSCGIAWCILRLLAFPTA
jgi:hypothetical protein